MGVSPERICCIIGNWSLSDEQKLRQAVLPDWETDGAGVKKIESKSILKVRLRKNTLELIGVVKFC